MFYASEITASGFNNFILKKNSAIIHSTRFCIMLHIWEARKKHTFWGDRLIRALCDQYLLRRSQCCILSDQYLLLQIWGSQCCILEPLVINILYGGVSVVFLSPLWSISSTWGVSAVFLGINKNTALTPP